MTSTLPTTTTDVGTVDQPNRWSRALITPTATTDNMMPTLMSCWANLVSANGPDCRRR